MLQKIQLRPGLNREGTDYSNEGGFYDGDKIRFRSGFPEKIGGWVQYSAQTLKGIARWLWTWVSLSGSNYMGVGTNSKFYVELGGNYNDVTPIYYYDTLTNPFKVGYTTLSSSVSSTSTTVNLTSVTNFPSTGLILIGTEQIFYTGISSTTLTNCIRGYNSTTASSHSSGANVASYSVTVTDANYSPNVGDSVIFSGASAFAGITIDGEYVVQYVPYSSTSYVITATTSSTSSATGGGTVTTQYEYPIGLNISYVSTGWGSSPWGEGGWGLPYSQGFTTTLRLWSADNYGQNLVIAPRSTGNYGQGTSSYYGGGIYYWWTSGTYPNGVTASNTARAQSLQVLSTAAGYSGQYVPNSTLQVITSAVQRFIICFGANSYVSGSPNTAFNPMLVRWSDQANEYQWVPDITNQSGEFALSNGSFIMGARATRQEILIWTDSAIYSMQYIGAPYVWGFQILMDNITTISPNCMVTVNNVTYWMGRGKFYMYSGRVETLPCSIRQYVFDDINLDQAFQIFAGSNEAYNEVWWFYVSNSSGGNSIDKYVIYNYLDRVWYYGTMARTAWLDSGIRTHPMAADYNNRILYHESGVDDNSTGTAVPINAYVQSSDFDISDGQKFGFVWRILPDVNFNGSTVNEPYVTMTVKPRQNSGTAYGSADTPIVTSSQNYTNTQVYNIQQFTGQVYTRLRGRQMAFRIDSNSLGVAWQLGSCRIDIKQDGAR